jgi:hypothetical protein
VKELALSQRELRRETAASGKRDKASAEDIAEAL